MARPGPRAPKPKAGGRAVPPQPAQAPQAPPSQRPGASVDPKDAAAEALRNFAIRG